MFKLLKLAFYALIGYAIYEMYQGLQAGTMGGGAGGGGRGESIGSNRNRGQFSGAGEGMDVDVEDQHGAESTHSVGRGVIS